MRNTKFSSIFLLLVVGFFASSLSGQTRRPKPKPLATPPVLTGAEIISQGGNEVEPAPPVVEERPAKPPTTNAERIRQLNDRLRKLEEGKSYEDRQKRVLMNLDILTRAESRAESLRKQLFDMIEKENTINGRLDQIEYDIRPEVVERMTQLAGSLRPEEVRENRRKSLAAEKANLQALMTQVQTTRSGLNASLQKAEQMVERLRAQAEKDIENALEKTDEDAAEK